MNFPKSIKVWLTWDIVVTAIKKVTRIAYIAHRQKIHLEYKNGAVTGRLWTPSPILRERTWLGSHVSLFHHRRLQGNLFDYSSLTFDGFFKYTLFIIHYSYSLIITNCNFICCNIISTNRACLNCLRPWGSVKRVCITCEVGGGLYFDVPCIKNNIKFNFGSSIKALTRIASLTWDQLVTCEWYHFVVGHSPEFLWM